MNTDAPTESALYWAERRVLEIQTKLHKWAGDDPHRRFDDPKPSRFAGQHPAAGYGDPEVLRHPQHIGLTVGLEVLPQLGAVTVNLVPTVEIGSDPVTGRRRAEVDSQLSLGAEPQIGR